MLPRAQTGGAIHNIVRLRRAERAALDVVRRDIEPVLTYLEEIAGSTVGRAEAARVLGVSQTALDRWVEKGEIAVVITPRGRREVPLNHLVDLLDQVELERPGSGSRALARVIRQRRRQAELIDVQALLPPAQADSPERRGRSTGELLGLAYHRLVASRLDERTIRGARRLLRHWRAHGRIDVRWADEWERVLARPLPEIAATIGADNERALALRQSSPFAGAVTEQERRRLLRAIGERVTA
jgi:hypothetical protein